MASQQQIRESITNQIISALESGNVPPWRRPWRLGPNAGFPANVVSKKPYRGINPILLDVAASKHNLASKWWATFNQWRDLGGRVMPRPSHVPSGTEQENSAVIDHLESATREGPRSSCLVLKRRSKAVLFSVLFPGKSVDLRAIVLFAF